jgi:TBC1 domain family protein 5
LLFGREFPFEELLEVWDVLFAEDPDLHLVDLICVAMLLRIRWKRERLQSIWPCMRS